MGMTSAKFFSALWNRQEELLAACHQFSQNLYAEAEKAGGAQYAELCSLAYRQVIGAHKLAAGPDGELLFVSKECYSNGCAATVDVSYPSVPLFLRYCPELVKGMLRPVFRYAQSEQWPFDFAPHDAGRYSLLNGQVYSDGTDPKHQIAGGRVRQYTGDVGRPIYGGKKCRVCFSL